VPATEENAPTGRREFHGVVDQIAKDGAEKQRVAENRCSCLDHTNADSLLQSRNLVLPTSFPKQGADRNRRQLHLLRVFVQPEGGDQLIKQSPQLINRVLAAPQQTQFRFCSSTKAEQLMRPLDDLKWLPEIVSGYRK
jgi:hypothetical protein